MPNVTEILREMTPKERIAIEIKQSHDRIAETYGGYQKGKVCNFDKRIEWIVSTILSRCSVISGKSVCLDIGCGNGQFTNMLAQLGFPSLVGADFSKRMLLFAQERAENCGYKDRVLLVQTSAEELPFPSNTFDLIFMYGVLEHLDRPRRVLGELWQATRQHGIIILDIPQKGSLSYYTFVVFGQSPRYWGTQSGRFSIRFREKMQYYRFYSTTQIVEWLRKAGNFEIVARMPSSYSHMVGPLGDTVNILKKKLGMQFERAMEELTKKLFRIPAGEIIAIRVRVNQNREGERN